MKQMKLENETLQSGVKSFFDNGSDMFVRCGFIRGQNCGPRCAACELETDNAMVDIYSCKRGNFQIGSVKD
jgi:hypothetical protein